MGNIRIRSMVWIGVRRRFVWQYSLYPNQPAGNSFPVDIGSNLHHGEATVSVGPHRRFHERQRQAACTWEVDIFDFPIKVVLPQSKQQDEVDACKEEANDMCICEIHGGHASAGKRMYCTHVDSSSLSEPWTR